MLRGNVKTLRGVSYLRSYEYKGFDRDPDEPPWAWTDVNVTFNLGPRAGQLTFGKQKEPFVYEMVGDAANLPHSERILSPFSSSLATSAVAQEHLARRTRHMVSRLVQRLVGRR
jgi:hypothetical protein